MSSHAQAKGTTRAVAVARASTGLTTHRPASAKGASQGATARETRPLVATGNPCASRMIPLESPVPEISTPGSESGGRKRTHGSRPAARCESSRKSHRPPTGHAPLPDSTRIWSVTLARLQRRTGVGQGLAIATCLGGTGGGQGWRSDMGRE